MTTDSPASTTASRTSTHPVSSPGAADAPVALVAGASRGLGLRIAQELLTRDHRVAICARDRAEVERAVAVLRERTGASARAVSGHVCDVADEAAVRELVERVEQEMGPIEVAVAVAGVIQVTPLESVTTDHLREALDVMAWGPIHVSLAVLPGMRRRGRGHIGVVSSVGGLVSAPHLLPYSTAKFAAAGFTDGLAAALAGTGVTATTIAPGLMRTGSHERATFAGDVRKEYGWFAPAASLPLVSQSADSAARTIVDGVLAGSPVVLVGWLPKLAVRVHGLAPGLTTRAMGVFHRLLPGNGVDRPRLVEGREVRRAHPSRLRDALATLGSRAARHNLQRDDEGPRPRRRS